MNIAGPVAATLFILTGLTVVGALISYAIFRARERTRAKSRGEGPMVLEFFVEYQLPSAGGVAHDRLSHTVRGGRSFWAALLTWLVLVAGAAGGVWIYYYVLDPGQRDARRGGQGGATTGKDTAGSGRAAGGSGSGGGGAAINAAAAVAAARKPMERGPQPNVPDLTERAASLFARAAHDLDGDGKIGRRERLLIQRRVPQFVLLSINDGMALEGFSFLRKALERQDVWRHTTFFLSGERLTKDVTLAGAWQHAADSGDLGVCVAPRGAKAKVGDWASAFTRAIGRLSTLRAPRAWRWMAHAWGARAAKLAVSKTYFEALLATKPPIRYDSSLVLQPLDSPARPRLRRRRRGRAPVVGALAPPRDLPWPFSLKTPQPRELMLPAAPGSQTAVAIGKPAIIEVPLAAWRLRGSAGSGSGSAASKASWQPPMDDRLWALYGCAGSGPNTDAVKAVMRNLRAHLRGNRAPFSIGLRPGNYLESRACKRRTIELLLDRIRQLIDDGANIRFVTVPELLLWLGRGK
ncbi:MAG: hypothetical protein KC503_38075 [Myxococcales bacterium]|nr:hypothetical protein [Myxococcales bacterium]